MDAHNYMYENTVCIVLITNGQAVLSTQAQR